MPNGLSYYASCVRRRTEQKCDVGKNLIVKTLGALLAVNCLRELWGLETRNLRKLLVRSGHHWCKDSTSGKPVTKESQPHRSDACPSAYHVPHKFVEDTSDWCFVHSRSPPKELQAMAVENSLPNGSAQAPIEVSSLPTVIGINFGNSYASIAVITNVCASTPF